MKRALTILLSVSGLLLACGPASTSPSPSPSPSGSSSAEELPRPTPRFPAGSCHAIMLPGQLMVLPDRRCTLGKADPRVTPESLFAAPNPTTPGVGLCSQGYTTRWVRPSSAYTDQQKRLQMTEYGFADALNQHEEDHLIPLELGGAPSDPANLWPEPGLPNPKDSLETYLRNRVCYTRDIPLGEAQAAIAANWVQTYQRYSVSSDWGQLKSRPLYK